VSAVELTSLTWSRGHVRLSAKVDGAATVTYRVGRRSPQTGFHCSTHGRTFCQDAAAVLEALPPSYAAYLRRPTRTIPPATQPTARQLAV
jgi:hypothetical protein